ncbi:MAG: hypothetical protein ACOC5M_01755 [Chloroflexota bacterium]
MSTLVVLGVAALLAAGAYGVYAGTAVGDLDDGGPKDEDTFKIPESAEEAARSTINRHDRLREVGERVPAFGGMYRERGREVLVVLLTDTGRKAEADAAIRAIFGDDWIPANGVEARDAQYEMRQLMEWWDAMMSTRLPDGVTWLAIAQDENRLTIGVDEESSIPEIESWLDDLGVPAGAYETPVMGEFRAG